MGTEASVDFTSSTLYGIVLVVICAYILYHTYYTIPFEMLASGFGDDHHHAIYDLMRESNNEWESKLMGFNALVKAMVF